MIRTSNPRRRVALAIVGLLAIAAAFFALTRSAQDGEADAQRVVQTFADQAAEACADLAQRDRLAEQGFSCKAIEDAAQRVEDGAEPVLVPGPEGERGLTGPQGAPGRSIVGPPGVDGPRGFRGEAGPSCVAELGLNACRGDRGSDGADSTIPGPSGKTGDAGKDGASITGPAGPTGPRGERGEQGSKGDPGPAGPAGADSTVPGPQGEQGPAGPQGIPGVINVTTSPGCADLMPNMKISLTYDASTQTLSLVCA